MSNSRSFAKVRDFGRGYKRPKHSPADPNPINTADSNAEQAQKILARVLFGMVVRERRRISSLARTASSLDEKLQQAEKTAEASEVHLRAYMDEQNRVAAELSNSQQKNILSLMEMVKAGGKKNALREESDERNDSDDRKLLVLANERIAVLESQIARLESDVAQENDRPEDFSTLRKAYNEACENRDEISDELRRTREKLEELREYLTSIESDQRHDSLERALGLIHGLLSRAKNDNGSDRPTGANKRSERMHVDLQRVESDSDLLPGDEDALEDPDLYDDIMEDLAWIAEGKIPPSLQDLPGFAEQLAEVENDSTEIENTENTSVFDRLTNPDNFTGTQKRKAKKPKKAQGLVASQRTDQSVKASAPDLTTASSTTPTHQTSEDVPEPTTSKKKYNSVFDRLISPSQATGIQRQKLARKNQSEDDMEPTCEAEDELDQVLDDVLGGRGSSAVNDEGAKLEYVSGSGSRTFSDSNTLESPKDNSRMLGRHYSDYAEQDVFERLSKTSTVSHQIRQGDPGRPGSNTPQNLLSEVHGRSSGSLNHSRESHEDFHTHHEDSQVPLGRQNVFERLQKPTEAYAKKVNKPRNMENDM